MRGARILVIDDFYDARTTLVDVLESVGEVVHACGTADAGPAVLTFRPDIVLIDVEVGTSALLAVLRPLTSSVFIAMLRSVPCPAGFAGSLQKPFGLPELLSAIKVALDPDRLQ